MAMANSSADVRPYAPPMAAPGYGKRSAPGQLPRKRGDFEHLPPREASVAAHIDRLPDGAAIDTKTLARELPAYGQQAVRSALNALSRAGHLRRVRETVGEGRTQWVYRTYFSRTARDDAWWGAFLREGTPPGEAPGAEREPVPAPEPVAEAEEAGDVRPSRRAEAYEVLAALGQADPRMTLSAAECADLAGPAAVWLERGASPGQLVLALTSGLPETVHCPGALARRRLADRLPPEAAAVSAAPASTPVPVPAPVPAQGTAPRRVMECTGCGRPGRPEALPGGLCRDCRGLPEPAPAGPSAAEVRARVERLRAGLRAPADRDRGPVPVFG
ncbi:hypothetical protein SAMN05192584_12076 [Streptomyces pini]|uniref:Uncharacterized protein n=2 Tax=Streptomyces pini TaxID=1520580 RepID=A0A1I4IAH8_9ACTN|nr:hypothetical protein SAMN05192584_12076 [Streptomyces pini]